MKMAVMKKLAGTTWGANSKILKQVYPGAVRTNVEYGTPTWTSAAKSNTAVIDKIQNQSLMVVLRAMKSTPTTTMENQSKCPPLEKRRKMKTFLQYEKSKRIVDHPIKSVYENRTKKKKKTTLKRNSPNHIAKEIANMHIKISLIPLCLSVNYILVCIQERLVQRIDSRFSADQQKGHRKHLILVVLKVTFLETRSSL